MFAVRNTEDAEEVWKAFSRRAAVANLAAVPELSEATATVVGPSKSDREWRDDGLSADAPNGPAKCSVRVVAINPGQARVSGKRPQGTSY